MKENKWVGVVSIISGVIGILLIPIPFVLQPIIGVIGEVVIYSTILIGILGILAFITGVLAYKNEMKDKKGKIGIILGIICLVDVLIWLIIYFYITRNILV